MKGATAGQQPQPQTQQGGASKRPPNRWAAGAPKLSDAASNATTTTTTTSNLSTPAGGNSPAQSQSGTPRSGTNAIHTPNHTKTNSGASSSSNSNPANAVVNASATNQPAQQRSFANVTNARSSSSNHAAVSVQKPVSYSPTAVSVSDDEQRVMRERMLYLLQNMVGSKVNVSLRSGLKYTGIMSTTSESDMTMTVKLARQLDAKATPTGHAKQSMSFTARDIVDIHAASVDFDTAPRPASPNQQLHQGGQSARDSAPSISQVMNGTETFRTDTDISGPAGQGAGRTLQKYDFGSGGSGADGSLEGGLESGGKFGNAKKSGGTGAWDQFAVNERLFGTKTNFDEEMYTTKLDRSGADFRDKEKRAQAIADEILGTAATNSHQAEERGAVVDDSGLDEEDKYSGVLRAPGSYVPPGARKGLGAQATIASAKKSQQDSAPSEPPAQDETADTTTVTDAEPSQAPTAMEASAPKAVTGTPLPSKVLRTGAATFVPSRESTPVESGGDQAGEGAAKPPTPTVSVTKVVSATNGQPAEVAGVFKKFVGMEKEKILNRRQDLARLGREEKLAELRAFSENFKLRFSAPGKEAAKDSASSSKPAAIAAKPDQAAPTAPTEPLQNQTSAQKAAAPSASVVASPNIQSSTNLAKTSSVSASTPQATAVPLTRAQKYALPEIPKWNPAKAAARANAAATTSTTNSSGVSGQQTPTPASGNLPDATSETSKASSKFNVAAKEFVFRPGAISFVPGGSPAAGTSSSSHAPTKADVTATSDRISATNSSEGPGKASAVAQPPVPINPFFGLNVPKPTRSDAPPFLVKEDFSPFRNGRLESSASVSADWGFSGKSYRTEISTFNPEQRNAMSPQPPAPASTQFYGMHPQHQVPNHLQHQHSQLPQFQSPHPAHQVPQPQQHNIQHAHHRSNTSNASMQSAARLQVMSPSMAPPSTNGGSSTGRMSRSPSAIGGLSTEGTVASSQTSAAPTPGPGQMATPTGPHAVHGPHHLPAQHAPGQPHMVPQMYTMYHPQQFPGAPYRMQSGLPQHGHGQPHGHPSHPGNHLPPLAIQHPGQMAYPGAQQYVGQMPFSPQMHAASPSIYNGQILSQGPPGANQYMSPMFVTQAGARGPAQQIAPGQPQPVFYQQMPTQPGMPPQYAMIPQGMPILPPPQHQHMYEKPAAA